MSPQPLAVELDAVAVWFHRRQGLAPLSLSIPAGSKIGLRGANGSGKSTALRVIAGLQRPSEGRVSWKGAREIDAQAMRASLGYVPQTGGLPLRMRAVDYLAYMAWLKRVPRDRVTDEVAEVLGAVGLAGVGGMRLRAMSGGMRRRVLVAQALVGRPGLLLLDEPTAGVDERQCEVLRQILADLPWPSTIILASHLPDDLAPMDTVVDLHQMEAVLT